jgi:hypothetical protein
MEVAMTWLKGRDIVEDLRNSRSNPLIGSAWKTLDKELGPDLWNTEECVGLASLTDPELTRKYVIYKTLQIEFTSFPSASATIMSVFVPEFR